MKKEEKKHKKPYRKHPAWAREFIRRARGDTYRYETICLVCDNNYSIDEIKALIKDINKTIELDNGVVSNRVYISIIKILRDIIDYKGGEPTKSEMEKRLKEIEKHLYILTSIEENRDLITELRKEHSKLWHKINDAEVFNGNSSRGIFKDVNENFKTVDFNEYETSYIVRDEEGIILDEGYVDLDFEEFFISGSGNKHRSRQDIYDGWDYCDFQE